jgi:hypothetical protein
VEVSFIGGGKKTTDLSQVTDKLCVKYTSQCKRFELTTLVVIGTVCTGSCKPNYHANTTTPIATTMINWKQNNIIILEKYYVYSVMPFYVWIQSFDFQPTRLFCIVGYSRNALWLLPLGRYIYWWIIRPLGYHRFSAEKVYYILLWLKLAVPK